MGPFNGIIVPWHAETDLVLYMRKDPTLLAIITHIIYDSHHRHPCDAVTYYRMSDVLNTTMEVP